MSYSFKCYNNNKFKFKKLQIIKVSKISTFVVFLAILTLTTKQMIRINENLGKEYFNYPWPKYFHINQITKKLSWNKYIKMVFLYIIDQKMFTVFTVNLLVPP